MLSLALLGLLPNDPESRSLNASPEVVGAALPFDFRAGTAEVDGVSERGLDEFGLDAASIANVSYFGRRAPEDGAGLAPSLGVGCEGFAGAEEFQRLAKESDIALGYRESESALTLAHDHNRCELQTRSCDSSLSHDVNHHLSQLAVPSLCLPSSIIISFETQRSIVFFFSK